MLAKLFHRFGAEAEGDGRSFGGTGYPPAGLEIVNLSPRVLEIDLGIPTQIIGPCVGAQNFYVPVFLAHRFRLARPVVVRVCYVAKQLLRVGVEERRGGKGRVATRGRGGGRASRVCLVDLALALVCQQAVAHLAVQGLELLLARRADGPRLAGCKGGGREEGRGRWEDLQTQAGEGKGVGVEVEEGGACCFGTGCACQLKLS